MRVGIVGAGAIALGSAARLHLVGHDAMIWSPSGRSTQAFSDGASLVADGALQAEFRPHVANSPAQLAQDNDVLLIAVPAYGHRAVMEQLAPFVKDGQHIIISSHASFGALYLTHLLDQRQVSAVITAWGTTAVTGRVQSNRQVTVNTVRRRIDLCTVPSAHSDAGHTLCRQLFGDVFQPRDGLLAIALSNLNPQNHMGIALGNFSRMERGEHWSQGQNVTPGIGRLLESLDAERLAIAAALDLQVKTIHEHFHQSFHIPIASISEMNQLMHEQGNGGTGPATADSRYVTEDVPYGLVPTVALGRLTGRPALLHEAGVRLFSAMYGRDFTAENELINALGMEKLSLDQLQKAAETGRLGTDPDQL